MKHSAYSMAVAIILVAYVTCADVRFKVEAARQDVPANENVELTVSAEWPQGKETYIIYTPTMPQMMGMAVVDHVSFGQSLTVSSQILQRMVHHFKLAVTNKPGEEAETGPIYVQFRKAGQQEKQERQLAGLTFNISPPKRYALKGALIGIASALVLGAGVILIGVRRSARPKPAPVIVGPTVENGFLEKLDAVKRFRLDGDIHRYFHELESLLKQYFRVKYQIGSINDWSAPASGPAGPDDRTASVARDLLNLSHSVCYAGYVPSARDQDRMFDFLKKLFVHNQPHRQVAEEELYLKGNGIH